MSTFYDSSWNRPRLPLELSLAAVIILLLTGWLWWAKVSVNPGRVFNGMLEHSLSTSSVTMHLDQSQPGASTRQAIQFQLGGDNFAHSTTTIIQNGNTVSTETLATKDVDYTRYTQIKTNGKTKDGKPINTASVENTWAKVTKEDALKNQTAQLFPQAVLGLGLPLGSLAVPMGNIPADARNTLLQQIRDDRVYDTDFTKAEKRHVNGRLAYAYKVKLQPITYVRMMQSFAKDVGLSLLDTIDPNQFSGSEPFTLTLVVDAHAQQLVEVDYPNSSFKETYSSYGLRDVLQLPTRTISNDELQKRLANLQTG